MHIDPSVKAVVYIGRMDVKKGLRELVDAAASLQPQRPDLHVYLVGHGPDKPIIESAVEAHNAAGYIHALEPCSFDEVAIWMAAADLVTLPSYMEGCPNVVLEALACGRPVVATNVGGIPEIMNEECGRLVPPRDPTALANALAEVLDESWDAAAISAQRGRSWENVADELLEIFESLVSDRRNTTTCSITCRSILGRITFDGRAQACPMSLRSVRHCRSHHCSDNVNSPCLLVGTRVFRPNRATDGQRSHSPSSRQ